VDIDKIVLLASCPHEKRQHLSTMLLFNCSYTLVLKQKNSTQTEKEKLSENT
jgi:hypothetical protein